jgi:hypothetical protein
LAKGLAEPGAVLQTTSAATLALHNAMQRKRYRRGADWMRQVAEKTLK